MSYVQRGGYRTLPVAGLSTPHGGPCDHRLAAASTMPTSVLGRSWCLGRPSGESATHHEAPYGGEQLFYVGELLCKAYLYS